MKKKGFTLIELLAVIVILALIALIVTPVVTKIIESAKKSAAVDSALGYIEAVEKYMMMNELNSDKYYNLEKNNKYYLTADSSFIEEDSDEEIINLFLNDFIEVKGKNVSDGYVIIGDKNIVASATFLLDNYLVTCEEKICNSSKYVGKLDNTWTDTICEENVCTGDSILNIMHNDTLTSGYYTFEVTGNIEGVEETVIYSVHLYVLDGNQTILEETFFGDDGDVSDGTNYASNMVAVKVNGSLTITETGVIRPYYNNYGGPKGFVLFVTGDLNNNGTIENNHGAWAVGDNVYLWKNKDDSYEYVPAVGGAGAVKGSAKNGTDGEGRATGGGSTGYVAGRYGGVTTYKAGDGTSYSGGSGTGGANCSCSYAGGSTGPVDNYGGPGGPAGSGCGSTSGGAGNPGKSGASNGTGGLLVIYAKSISSYSNITANGAKGGTNSYGGGGSGGGSINIFGYNLSTAIDYEQIVNGVKASGGEKTSNGGKPGDGCVNIGSIRGGKYTDIRQLRNKSGNSILSIISNPKIQTGYYYFTVEGKTDLDSEIENITYSTHVYVLNGNQIFDQDMTFGDESDVGTSSDYAKNTVILKVNGDLTITENGVIRPYYNNYGGPKGFIIYVTGKLINNGIIENNYGAYAEGENVYLVKNNDGSFEYIPAVGASGGKAISGSRGVNTYETSNPGDAALEGTRATGGGGTGLIGIFYYGYGKHVGKGGNGTSYSGGSGSGGTGDSSSSSTSSLPGSDVGGAGGYKGSTGTSATSSAGAGNPSGGTGGLIVIYANDFVNNNIIRANGSSAVSANYPGGSSGGGSVNIFYKNEFIKGTITALGGETVRGSGAGGTGTVTFTKID